MASSTLLSGPYDGIPTYDKVRIMCGIPSEIAKDLFTDTFTLRGVQDKILARLFHIFYLELTSKRRKSALTQCITNQDKELLVNEILNHLAAMQSQIENEHNAKVPDTKLP